MRLNFDDFQSAFITTFQILTMENWQINLFFMMRADVSKVITVIYLVSWIFIGNYVFLNLFLAILLDGFTIEGENEEKEKALESSEKSRNEGGESSASVQSARNPDATIATPSVADDPNKFVKQATFGIGSGTNRTAGGKENTDRVQTGGLDEDENDDDPKVKQALKPAKPLFEGIKAEESVVSLFEEQPYQSVLSESCEVEAVRGHDSDCDYTEQFQACDRHLSTSCRL